MQQKLIYISFILISVIAYGQVNMSLKSDKSDYNAKEIVNLTIKIELNGDNLVQQSPVQLPDLSKFNIIGSGSVTNALVDPETNTAMTQLVTRLALEPKQKGKIKIGSVLITVNNKIYKTEPFNVFIRDVEKKSAVAANANDVFLNMEIEDREVYQDQPTVAVLRVYSKNIDNLRKVKNVRLPQQENLNVHPVNYKRSDIDPSGIGNMPSQILAVFMVFPTESGSVEVPSVSASVNSYGGKSKVVSNKVKINVKKLPEGAPENFKNAVGNFSVKIIKTSAEKVEKKKPVNITVKVSGEGNLSDLVLPKILPSDKYEIYSPNIRVKSRPGENGLKGEILENYVLIPQDSGDFEVKTEAFSFFDPIQRKYVDLGEKSLKLSAFTHDEVLAARSTVEKVNEYTNTILETVNNPVIKTATFKVKEKEKFNWNILFINAVLLGGIGIAYFAYKTRKRKSVAAKAVAAMPLGSVAETEINLKSQMRTNFEDYFSYLNQIKSSGDYPQFFRVVDEMDAKMKNEISASATSDFYKDLDSKFGSRTVEDYKNLQQKLQFEKYSPVQSSESVDDLYHEVVKLYSKITK